MPRNRARSTMFCPGISQNSKLHHLTLNKGQVLTEKSYFELCDHNVFNVFYLSPDRINWGLPPEKNGKLIVPPVPGQGFIIDDSMIPWDTEILHSFAEITKTTNITFYSRYDIMPGLTFQINVGTYEFGIGYDNEESRAPPNRHTPWYIWTKEGFLI